MNEVWEMGRLCRDPETKEVNQTKIARYTLAVDRAKKKGSNEKEADFISCVAFGKNADFAEKYLKKGTKIIVNGSIHTNSYTKKDGTKVFQTDVYVARHEFPESKAAASDSNAQAPTQNNSAPANDVFSGFKAEMPEELPFS